MAEQNPETPRKTGANVVVAAVVVAVVAVAFGLGALAIRGGWLHGGAGSGEDEDVASEVPVHAGAITKATLRRFVDAYGAVVPDSAHDGLPPASAKLAAPVAGILAKLSCSEGERVAVGAALFQLDARAAAAEEQKAAAAAESTKATLARLKLAVDFADGEMERTKRLKGQGLASDKDLHEAELKLGSAKEDLAEANAKTAEAKQTLQAAHVMRSLTTIKAPLAGTVVKIHVSPGESVDATTVLADIIDLDRLVVAAQVPATELRLLKVGQAVTIDPAAPGEKPATEKAGDAGGGTVGAVTFLGFEVDPKTGTVLVRASLPKDAPLRPGQYVRVRVQVEEQVDCLAVPEQSLVEVADVGATIALLDGDDAKQVPVEVGIRERGLACVKGDGLKVGTAIVTAGAYGLPKETKVRVLPE